MLVSLANVFWSCVFFTEDDEEIKHGDRPGITKDG